jgi:DNA-directed RNA polymerase subunit N (RpoN/RPB10)
MTCGKVIASKWNAFQKKIKEMEKSAGESDTHLADNFEGNLKGTILDDIGVTKICCRRHMLTHVDLVDIL